MNAYFERNPNGRWAIYIHRHVGSNPVYTIDQLSDGTYRVSRLSDLVAPVYGKPLDSLDATLDYVHALLREPGLL